ATPHHGSSWRHSRREPPVGVVVLPSFCPVQDSALSAASPHPPEGDYTAIRSRPGSLACNHVADSRAKGGVLPVLVSEHQLAGGALFDRTGSASPALVRPGNIWWSRGHCRFRPCNGFTYLRNGFATSGDRCRTR